MGQQQLLLLVLGIVIVGLAVVVGINAFSENQIKANADALVTDGLRLASDIQAYVLKPEQFGGGNDGDGSTNDLTTFDGLGEAGWEEIGVNPEGTDGPYANVNGQFSLAGATASGWEAAGTTSDCSGVTGTVVITATNGDTDNLVCIGIDGTGADDIDTDVAYGS